MNLGVEFMLERRSQRVAQLREQIVALLPQPGPLVFEIGCGHGHYLTSYGDAHRDYPCIGIDLITKRIGKSNAKAEKRGLSHVRFIKAELTEFLDALPQGYTFKRVFMLFPDPWPKKRHHKNRMVQTPLLDTLATRMSAGDEFCYRTDDRPYFDWTVEHLEANPHWQIDPAAPWPFEERSFFQDLMSEWHSLVARRV